jgi:hypothetical protein
MCRKTHDSPDCAGQCSRQIELVPSLRARCARRRVVGSVLRGTLFGVSLSLPARIVDLCRRRRRSVLTGFVLASCSQDAMRTHPHWVDDSLIARCGPCASKSPLNWLAAPFAWGSWGWFSGLKAATEVTRYSSMQDHGHMCHPAARPAPGVGPAPPAPGGPESGKLIPSDPKV